MHSIINSARYTSFYSFTSWRKGSEAGDYRKMGMKWLFYQIPAEYSPFPIGYTLQLLGAGGMCPYNQKKSAIPCYARASNHLQQVYTMINTPRENPAFHQRTSWEHNTPGTSPLKWDRENGPVAELIIQDKVCIPWEGWLGTSSFNHDSNFGWQDALFKSNRLAILRLKNTALCSGEAVNEASLPINSSHTVL